METNDWAELTPLRRFELPDFPVQALPDWAAEYITAVAEDTQTPVDLAGMMLLAVLAVAVQKKARIELKRTWKEPLNLYSVSFLPSGERKSAVVEGMAKPVHDFECYMWKKQKELATSESLSTAAEDCKPEKKDLNPMESFRMLAEDCTPEKLVDIMANNNGTISVLSAEGDFFDILCGRYSEAANLGVYLKAHTGEELRVDRITRESNYVQNPCITLGLAVQPEVLDALLEKKAVRGRGLMARLLFSIPKSTVGSRNVDAQPVPESIERKYKTAINKLLEMQAAQIADGYEAPYMLTLTDEAQGIFLEYQREIEPMLREDAEFGEMRDWAGKLAGTVARIAGLLHYAGMVDNLPGDTKVQADTIKAAIVIGNYLANHARAALARSGYDGNAADAECLVKWIIRERITEFTKREAHRRNQVRFTKAAEMDGPLAMLVDHNYIRAEAIPQEWSKSAGRPASQVYEVNPRLKEMTEMTKYVYKPISVNCVTIVTE